MIDAIQCFLFPFRFAQDKNALLDLETIDDDLDQEGETIYCLLLFLVTLCYLMLSFATLCYCYILLLFVTFCYIFLSFSIYLLFFKVFIWFD